MNKNNYIPKDKRKTILLISDDIRAHSGVATVAREVVFNVANRFNIVNIAGSIKHGEEGQRLDLSKETDKLLGMEDSSVILWPVSGYGNPDMVKQLIKLEKIDAIMLITDPRYFTWLFSVENEIRKTTPIIYLNIWDDLPAPHYNLPYYSSCDLLLGISKQTKNINQLVLSQGQVPYVDLDDDSKSKFIPSKRSNPIITKYVPHGLNETIFHPLSEEEKNEEYIAFKEHTLGGREFEFVLLFNSRNIRRKQVPDTLLAYKYFIDSLSEKEAAKCAFLLHTQICDDNGTDLEAVCNLIFAEDPKYNIIFSDQILSPVQMNWLYNMSDAQILLTSNEGWGLSLTEAILAGRVIIANVTGGMQDQMRFNIDGKWIEFDKDFPSNHNGTITECGEWAFPVFPNNKSLIGSPETPYIWDDRCTPEDAANQIMNVYNMSREEREERGLKGRNWAIGNEAGFTSEIQANRIIEAVDILFKNWKSREKFEFININKSPKRNLNHKLQY